MNLPFDFHPAVRDEINDAYRWYEHLSPKLGRSFLNKVESLLNKSSDHPDRFGFAQTDIREGLLVRFPYAVSYRVLSNSGRVLAVYHTSRDSSGWQSRN